MSQHEMAMNNHGETTAGIRDVSTVYCRADVKRGL